jgi:hypothetical protein
LDWGFFAVGTEAGCERSKTGGAKIAPPARAKVTQ